MRIAHTAASTARTARRASQEASRLAGALADRRAAADAEVAEAVRRLRAVHGLRPVRVAQLVRGRVRSETLRRTEALRGRLLKRDAIVGEVHAQLDDARRLSAEADAAASRAAALPRLLDELARLIHDAGGDDAERLAAAEAQIATPLTSELALSHALQATRHARARIQRGDRAPRRGVRLGGARRRPRDRVGHRRGAGAAPGHPARAGCRPGGDRPLVAVGGRVARRPRRRGPPWRRPGGWTPSSTPRSAEIARQRAQVRHAVAGSRAVRIEILAGRPPDRPPRSF